LVTLFAFVASQAEAAEGPTPPPADTNKSVTKKRAWPDRIGPFELKNEKTRSSIRFGFAAQPHFQLESLDQGPDADRRDDYAFQFRRIREILKGSLLSEDLTYAFQLNTTPGNIELLDLYLSYRFTPRVQLTLGQRKVPFTRYRGGSFTKLTFVDWAITAKYFGSERQRGFTLQSGAAKGSRVAYAFGVYTGENARSSHGIGVAKVYGEPLWNQSDLVSPAVPASFHPEAVAHVRYQHRGIDTTIDSDLKRGPPRFAAGLSAAYDLRPTPYIDFSHRIAPELLLKLYGFSLASLFYAGFSEERGERMAYRPAMLGMLFQVSYVALNRLELSARYALVDIDDDLRREARDRAQEEIGYLEDDIERIYSVDTSSDPVRAEELARDAADKEAELSALRKVGTLDRDHELTLGLNVFIIGTSLRWQADVSWLKHELVSGTRNDLRFRTQLTLAF
jgi:hypothetical protein